MSPVLQSDLTKMLATWAHELACPACHMSLRFEPSRIGCTGCSRIYPIIDGIPVLIAAEAARADTPAPK